MTASAPPSTTTKTAITETSELASPRWLAYYYLVQIVCQLALLTSWLSSARVLFRSSAFSMSIAALVLTSSRKAACRPAPTPFALLVLLIVALETFHPETSSALGALATLAMYAAILGPIFWVPRLDLTVSGFRRVVFLIWGFQSLSALVGALQIYFPGLLQPAISTVLADDYVHSLTIRLSSGETILRPSGLTDTPGGAAGAGAYAIILALGLLATRPSRLVRSALVLSIGIGMFVLYLSQIRALVVMTAISIFAMGAVYAATGKFKRVLGVSLVAGAVAVVAFAAALSVGGDDMTRRLATLTDSSPTEVYYTNRGIFLEHTLTDLLPQYPLGAGLGRWGMVSNYFVGDPGKAIYVEIQWTGWLLDGGILLILVYVLMLVLTVVTVWRATMRGQTVGEADMSTWGAMIIGYDVGAIALMFNIPVFMSAFGLDFWLLNTALLVVCARALKDQPTLASR